MTLWILTIAAVVVIALILCVRLFRGPSLSVTDRKTLRNHWSHAAAQQDPHRKLLEADAVVARLLEKLGHKGSMADKLRSAESVIPNINDVWAAHKLRNRIAHEPGVRLTDSEVSRALSAFERVIRKFCA